MADLYLSDVHLRRDRPERGLRLARLVDTLGAGDRLVIVGDLCDFWFASRQSQIGLEGCAGLISLRDFRSRGGELLLLPGNHDGLLGSYYEKYLGVNFAGNDLDLTVNGLRVHLVHGHLLGARKPWKALLEGRGFLRAFGMLPHGLAQALEDRLERSNDHGLAETERHHRAIYRNHARTRDKSTDMVVFGHIHTPMDDDSEAPRMVILGGWHQRTSYMRVENGIARLVVEEANPDSSGGFHAPDGVVRSTGFDPPR